MALAIATGMAFSWLNLLVGLLVRDPESAGLAGLLPVIILVFARSTLVPVSTMPGWLQTFAKANPITVIADALRVLCLAGPATRPVTGACNGQPASSAPIQLPGQITHQRKPQAVFSGESLAQALRQLVIYGRDGLPVLSADGHKVAGWVTDNRVLQAVARQLHAAQSEAAQDQIAANWAVPNPQSTLREPPSPLRGYQIVEVTVPVGNPAAGQTMDALTWPDGWTPVSVLHERTMRDPDPGLVISPDDRVILLARQAERDPAQGRRAGPRVGGDDD